MTSVMSLMVSTIKVKKAKIHVKTTKYPTNEDKDIMNKGPIIFYINEPTEDGDEEGIIVEYVIRNDVE